MKSSHLFGLSCVVLGAAVVFAAAPACTPAASPTNTARAEERAAVAVAVDAWGLAANACADAADLAGDAGHDQVLTNCAKYLVPAHDLLLSAASAVDGGDAGWSDSAACNLVAGVKMLAQAASDPALKLPANLDAVLTDATVVAQSILGSSVCLSDAGSNAVGE